MKKLHERLLYYPVDPKVERRALEFSERYLSNPLWPTSPKYLDIMRRKRVLCDSGGLQILNHIRSGNRPLVGPMLKTNVGSDGDLTIGIASNCQEYARIESSIAFFVDFPSHSTDSDSVWYWKLRESIKARNHMLKMIPHISPTTRPAIALQPRNPLEVAAYFRMIYHPSVQIYGYPARNQSDHLGNAYVLSFLHHEKVPYAHFLASSAASVIYLLVYAITLDMFEEASFDSTTWIRRRWGIRLINPERLGYIPKEGSIDPKGNLYWHLRQFPDFLNLVQKQYQLGDMILADEWYGIINIMAIDYFKDRALDAAGRGDLLAHIRNYNPRILGIAEGFELLNEAKIHGHEYVDKKYRARIAEESLDE